MTKDEAILKIKEQLKKLMTFSEAGAPVEEKKMASMKLKDGSEIMIPDGADLTAGVEVYMIDDAGNQMPCEDGTYELEDGKTITVKGGLIESVAEASTDTPPGEETQSPESPAQMEDAKPEGDIPETEGGDLAERVGALEQQLAQILELLQGMSNAQEMAMSKIQELADAPGAAPIKVGKTFKSELSDIQFSSAKDELAELKELKKKFKINNGGYAFNAAQSK